MSPASIRTRVLTGPKTKGQKRFDVRYRLGGLGYPLLHAGTFRTVKEARIRRDLVAGELAAGRDPRVLLEQLRNPPQTRLFREAEEAWIVSRHDVSDKTRALYRSRQERLAARFGDRDPHTIQPSEVSTWIGELAQALAPGTVSLYVSQLRLILGHAGVRPNPARDESVKLPSAVREEPIPPSADHVLALLNRIGFRWRLPLVTLEQTAMRVSEAEQLTWADVDVAGNRFRLSRTDTKTRRARWVQVPAFLMELIADTCPPEDRRSERRVFPRFERNAARNAMAAACKLAGIPHYHPHDLRHRRTSLWHGQGIPEAELAKRVGHTRPSLTLDLYSHVMPLDEVPETSLAALVRHG